MRKEFFKPDHILKDQEGFGMKFKLKVIADVIVLDLCLSY